MARPLPETLPLPLPIARDRAYELAEIIPLEATYTRYFMTTNGRKRGPYFKASFVRGGRGYVIYVGNQERKHELEAAHALVRAELEAEAAAVDPRVGDMLDRHARLYGNWSKPIEALKRSTPARPGTAAGVSSKQPFAAKLGEVTR